MAAWLQILTGIGVERGFALCIAEDGHAAIEVAHLEESCATEVDRHRGPTAAGLGELDRHPCTDVALSQPSLRPSLEALPLDSPGRRSTDLVLAPPRPHAIARRVAADLVPPHLRALSKIVLLA